MGSFWESMVFVLSGLPVTIGVTVLALLLAMPMSFLLALGRMSPWRVVSWPSAFFVEVFRGTSALIQLFWAFYVLPLFGITLSPLAAGVIVLGLNESAYFSEVVRAALQSVMAGQRDAVIALHLPRHYRFFRVILPQALPLMVPPFGNAVITMIKFTSLVSLVTLHDLSFRAGMIRASTGDSAAVYGFTLMTYFALSLIALYLITHLAKAANVWSGRKVAGTAAIAFASRRSPIPRWAFGK
jgi:polar amino acid transport system permease protein